VNAICIIALGVVRATLPAPEFTLSWEHSVQKSQWEERYRIAGTRLEPVQARVQSFGAGMEPPPDARLEHGWWTWQPDADAYKSLTLTHSTHARDYRFCWNRQCASLTQLVGPPAANSTGVTVQACDATAMPARQHTH
jgi:hypothetical protein